jgi:hypothetical protein
MEFIAIAAAIMAAMVASMVAFMMAAKVAGHGGNSEGWAPWCPPQPMALRRGNVLCLALSSGTRSLRSAKESSWPC